MVVTRTRPNAFVELESGRGRGSGRIRSEVKREWLEFVDDLPDLMLNAAIVGVGATWILIAIAHSEGLT